MTSSSGSQSGAPLASYSVDMGSLVIAVSLLSLSWPSGGKYEFVVSGGETEKKNLPGPPALRLLPPLPVDGSKTGDGGQRAGEPRRDRLRLHTASRG